MPAQRFMVGPARNGYIYNLVESSVAAGPSGLLWRCDKSAMGWTTPPNWRLFIVRSGSTWLAMHAPADTATAAAVLQINDKVFGSKVPDVTVDGWHEWDSWDTDADQWSGRTDWQFETKRLS